VKTYSKIKIICLMFLLASSVAMADWDVDLTRRKEMRQKQDLAAPGEAQKEKGFLDALFQPGEPIQDVVILNTESGFVPNTFRARVGMRYNVHVVNINEKEKNVSFVLDAFSEHHATYYGKVKTFKMEPKKEGIYSFQCPETSTEGRLVVYPALNSNGPGVELRQPASQR
jgi:hypothetical protein